MTSPEKILALATAHGGQYEAYVGSGVKTFTSAEIGHYLAGLKRHEPQFKPLADGAVRVLLLRYANGGQRDAEELVEDMLDDSGPIRDWVEHAAKTSICRAVLAEFLSSRRCGVCEGRTTVMHDNRLEACDTCDATGYRPLSTANRAKACGVVYHQFRRGAAERYYTGRLRKLHAWEVSGLRRVTGKARSGGVRITEHQRRVLERVLEGDHPRVLRATFDGLALLPIVGSELKFLPEKDRELGELRPARSLAVTAGAVEDLFIAAGVAAW